MVTGHEIILDHDSVIQLARNKELVRTRVQLRGNSIAIVSKSKLRINRKVYIGDLEYTVIILMIFQIEYIVIYLKQEYWWNT